MAKILMYEKNDLNYLNDNSRDVIMLDNIE